MTANYSNASSVGMFSETYNYDCNGNMLTSAGEATFGYDAKGRQVMSAYGSGLSTEYNLLDLPQRQTTGEDMVVYLYSDCFLETDVEVFTSVSWHEKP